MNSAISLPGSLCCPDFPISAQRHSNTFMSFCLFAYKLAFSRKAFKSKSFFQNSNFIIQES